MKAFIMKDHMKDGGTQKDYQQGILEISFVHIIQYQRKKPLSYNPKYSLFLLYENY